MDLPAGAEACDLTIFSQPIGWNSSLMLREIYVDGWFRRAEQSPGWLINTGRRSGRDRQAEQVNE